MKTKKSKKKINNVTRLTKIISIIILIFSIMIFLATIYYKKNFAEQSFETLLYNTFGGIKQANLEVILKGIVSSIVPFIIVILILFIPIYSNTKNKYFIDFYICNYKHSIQIYPYKNLPNHILLYSLLILFFVNIYTFKELGVMEFINSQLNVSEIFENEYVNTKEAKLTFPKKKRNLIYIFMESMESSLFTIENGGGYSYSIIPELEKMAQKNINFSDNFNLGGAMSVSGTEWTVAGMVAQTGGIPLKLSIDGNMYSGYKFLPGLYSLGDILKEEGYNLEIMMGSDANFGGRKDYFTTHGDYKIFDLNYAIENGKMKSSDKVWWGFSDDDLFKWSKEEIINLSKEDKPFNYIMLTADTHFIDGYLSEKAKKKYKQQYENVFAYSSKSVNNFINWIKKQPFYKNTTIVLVGDHLGMQTEFYEKNLSHDFPRRVYNTIINSAIKGDNTKNRKFSTIDMFPTVLASMGVEIEGDRLGLGTNLFSNKKTLIEEMGFDNFNYELSKKSNFYNNELLKGDYLKLLETKDKQEKNK